MRSSVQGVVLFLSVATAFASAQDRSYPDYAERYRDQYTRMMACGPLALIAIAENLGVELDEAQRQGILAVAESGGTDLLLLKELAKSHGLHAVGVRGSRSLLVDTGMPAIMVRGQSTFVAVLRCEKGTALVQGPLESPKMMTSQEFDRTFGENFPCLLLDKAPIDAASLGISHAPTEPTGPLLVPAKSVLAVGRLTRHDWTGQIALENRGTTPVRIESVKTTCTCLDAKVGQELLQPGESTTLVAKGVQDALGIIAQAIIVKTDVAGIVEVPIRGWLAPPAFFDRPIVVFDPLVVAEQDEAQVKVILPTGADPKKLRLEIPDGCPIEAELHTEGIVDEYAAVINLRCTGDAKWLGWNRWQISVLDADNQGEAIPAKLEVVCNTQARYTATPSSLWIKPDELKSGTWSRRILVQSIEPIIGEIGFSFDQESADSQIVFTQERISKQTLRLTLTPHADADVKKLEGQVLQLKLWIKSNPDLIQTVRLRF